MSNIDEETFKSLCCKDYSIDEICKYFNISKGKYNRLCKKWFIIKEDKRGFKRGHYNKTSHINKNLLYKLYIEDNKTLDQIEEILNISSTVLKRYLKEFAITKDLSIINSQRIVQNKQTCLKKYGVDNVSKVKIIRDQMTRSLIKTYSTGDPIETRKNTCLKKYGVEYPISLKEIQNKRAITMRANNTFTTSKPQKEIENLLRQKFPDLEIEYYSERYPWKCDFYIPSLDLFIEYQGTWQHGKKPYDKNDPECCNILEKWLEGSKRLGITTSKKRNAYEYAIKVYTQEDPAKRTWAKDHNLNWKAFFTVEEVREWLTKLNYNKED